MSLLIGLCSSFYLVFFSSINVFVCFAYRLLAREGLNAEQLARDLKSFELKVNAPFTLI